MSSKSRSPEDWHYHTMETWSGIFDLAISHARNVLGGKLQGYNDN
jgi:hypothetical protein